MDQTKLSNEKPVQVKSKPKGIVLKKNLNNSLFVGDNSYEQKQKEK